MINRVKNLSIILSNMLQMHVELLRKKQIKKLQKQLVTGLAMKYRI